MNKPFLSLQDVTALHGAEINEAVGRVVNSGWYLQGKENEKFEKNYANFMIASEELEPGTGWDYSFLSLIGGNYSPQGTARACIDTFNNYEPVSALTGYGSYMLPEELTIKSPITLSCVDLQKIDPLNQAVNNLFTAMDNSLQQGKLQPARVRHGI